MRRNRFAVGMDGSDFIGVIIEQMERSLNVVAVHFAMSLWSNLGDHLKSQADYIDSFKMKLKKFTKQILYKYTSNNGS